MAAADTILLRGAQARIQGGNLDVNALTGLQALVASVVARDTGRQNIRQALDGVYEAWGASQHKGVNGNNDFAAIEVLVKGQQLQDKRAAMTEASKAAGAGKQTAETKALAQEIAGLECDILRHGSLLASSPEAEAVRMETRLERNARKIKAICRRRKC